MSDSMGVYTKLDQLLPTERLRDSKDQVVHQDHPRKKRNKKPQQGFSMDGFQPEEEKPLESPKEKQAGKILDIVV